MIFILVYALIVNPASSQRYAERNVIPADTFPSSDATYDNYEYDYNGYSFDDDDGKPNVYKWNVEEFPHPITTPQFCKRLKPSHVCDPDQVLTKEQADALDNFIDKLYRDTPCICETCNKGDGGIIVGIALLKHMFLPFNVHPAKVIRSFTETLRFRWKLGSCDNDILIVVATTDRLSYTDVGSATSSYLSIHEAHRIFLENKAKFSAFNFSEGLLDILQGYYKATRAMESVIQQKNESVDMTMVSGIIVGCVLLLGIILFIGFVLYRRHRMNKISEDDDDEPAKKVRGESVSSSWTKKDIKTLFGSESQKSSHPSAAKYQKCGIDEGDAKNDADDEEVIDFRLATPDDTSFPNDTQLTNVTTDSEDLEKDLEAAAEGIVRTFPRNNNNHTVLTTDM